MRVLTTQNPTGSQIEIPTTNIGTIVVEALDAAAATSTVLSNVLYADNGTAVPVPDQNGSINAPFGTLVAGLAATPAGGTLLVTPRNYTAEGTLTIAQSVTIASINPTLVSSILVQALIINNGVVFSADGLVVAGTTASPAGGVAVLSQSQLGVVTGILNLNLSQQSVLTAATAVASLTATDSVIGASVTCSGSTITLDECTFSNGITITFSGGPGVLELDGTSYREFLKAGVTLVNGTIRSNSFLSPAANSAALATAAYANIPQGQRVYVKSRLRSYVSVPVGAGDIAGTGNDWKSEPSTSSPALQTVAAWFVDPAGSDDNNGTNIATPLATLNELQSRWGNSPVLSATVVNLANGNYGATQQALNFAVSTSTTVVEIAGTPSAPITSDTVGTFTVPSTVTNRGYLLTGTLIADFTPYVGKRIRFTASGAVCCVLLQNPFGLGNGTAEITAPQNEPVAPNYTSTSFAPVGGNAFVVEDLPVIGRLTINNGSAPTQVTDATFKNVPSCVVKSINCPQFNCSLNTIESAGMRIWGSLFNALGVVADWQNTIQFNASLITVTDFTIPTAQYNGCGFKTGLLNPVTAITVPQGTHINTSYFEGVGVIIAFAGAFMFNCGIFNSTVDGLVTNAQAPLTIVSGFLLGSGNALFGITIGNGTIINKIGGFANMKITGTSGDWHFGTGTAFAWADAPRAQNYGSFSGTLGAGGTVNVPITNLPADANAWATARVLAGVGATGVLRVPAQTTAQVTVTAAVAAETSTFAGGWISPSSAAGGIFAT